MKLGHKRIRRGFTLIELSFAVAFISILLITVTLITNEIIQIYRKGYSIKAINQVGRELIDEFQNSIIQSPPASITSFCSSKYPGNADEQEDCDGENSNHGFYSIYQQFYTPVRVTSGREANPKTKQVPTGGIFCSGKYTYIWNTGYLFNLNDYEFQGSGSQTDLREENKIELSYQYQTENGTQPGSNKNFHLVKIEDASGAICSATLDDDYPSTNIPLAGPGGSSNHTITIPFVLSDPPEEILAQSDADLALYDLVVFEPARVGAADRLLFSGSFILGTISSGVDIMTNSDFCQTPSYFTSDFSYCAINKFNFTIQTSSK